MHATRSAVSEHWAPARPSRAAHNSPRGVEQSRFTELPGEVKSKELDALTPPAEWAPPRATTPIIDKSADSSDLPEPIEPAATSSSSSSLNADATEWTAAAMPSSAEITAIAERFGREMDVVPVSNGVEWIGSTTPTVILETIDAADIARDTADGPASSQDEIEPGQIVEPEPVKMPASELVVEIEPTPLESAPSAIASTASFEPSLLDTAPVDVTTDTTLELAESTPETLGPVDKPASPAVEMTLSDLDFDMLGSASFGGPAKPTQPLQRALPSDELVAFDDDKPAVLKPVERSSLFQKAVGGLGSPPKPRTVTFAAVVKPAPPVAQPAPIAAPRTISSSARARRPVLAESDDEAQF